MAKRKTAKRAAPSPADRKRIAAAWAALEKLAKSQGDRSLLEAGEHEVALRATVLIDEAPVVIRTQGRLVIAPDSEGASSSGAPADQVLALAIALAPPKLLAAWLEELPEQYAASGELPAPDEAHLASAQRLLKRLRSTKLEMRRGAVSFARL